VRAALILLIFLTACVRPAPTVTPPPTAQPYPAPVVQEYSDAAVPTVDVIVKKPSRVFLAPLFVSRPLRGTEVWEGSASSTTMLPIWAEMQPDFIRLPIVWSHVEIARDVYVWPTRYDLDMAYLRSEGILPVLTVKMAPGWARTPGSDLCARPLDVDNYAEFAARVAARYPGPLVVEIWNEPDVPQGQGEADYYGCWGDPAAPSFGGGYYRQILDAAYPAIKAANPEATVLAGALMINCLTCAMADYVKGWADSPNYDALSFHYYTWHGVGVDSLPETIIYLSQFTTRPLWLTETAVVANVCDKRHEGRSVNWARYVRQDYRLSAVSWFFLQPSGWRCVDLLYPDWSRKPVYKEWMP